MRIKSKSKKSKSKKSKSKKSSSKCVYRSRGKKSSIRQRGRKFIFRYKRQIKDEISIKGKNEVSYFSEEKLEQKEIFPNFSVQGFFKKEDIHDVNDQLQNSFIAGLLSFNVLYNPVCNKIIYLMGEQHNFDDLCPRADNMDANEFFFKIINSNNGNKLDIFLESVYEPLNPKCIRIKSDRVYCNSFMTNVIRKLGMENCLSVLHEGCKYYKDYIRFHSIDVRSKDISFFLYPLLIREIQLAKNLKELEPLINKIMSNTEFYHIFSNITEFFNMSNKMLSFTKINKQLSLINPNIRKILLDEYSKILAEQFTIFNYNNVLRFCNWYNNYKLVGRSPTTEKIININDLNRLILTSQIKFDNIFMDLFIIARIFRKFSHPSILSTNLQSFPQEPTNIIIYTGDHHTQFYHKILSQMGFQKIFSAKPTDKISCLELQNFNIKWVCNTVRDKTCLLPLLYSDVPQWNVNEVLIWFNSFKNKISSLPETRMKIEQIFENNEIDGRNLLLFNTYEDLVKMGIPLGPAIKLFTEIQTLKYYY